MIKYNYKLWLQRFNQNKRLVLADLQWKTFEEHLPWHPLGIKKVPIAAKRLFPIPLPNGRSFLVNELDFVLGKEKWEEKALYLELASMRSLWDYDKYGVITLPEEALLKPEQIASINKSSCMNIKDGNIHFLYEENYTSN